MAQALAALSAGNLYIQAPVPGPRDKPAGRFADPLAAFQLLFNDGEQFDAPSSWERVKHLTPQPILSFGRSTWNIEVDGAKRRVAHFLNVGKLEQAARASRFLGETYWNHFLIQHAEQAYFFGAALAIGKADLTTLDLGDVSLREALFAEMIRAGVAESNTAPSELNVGSHWPVFTPLLHGGKYGAITQKYTGLGYVRREFRHDAPVQGTAGGITFDIPIDSAKAEEVRDGEIAALRKIEGAGIRIPANLLPAGQTAYVRTFVQGETLENLPHAAFPLTEEQRLAARIGYHSMVLVGLREGLWQSEPSMLNTKAIFETTNDLLPESPANWVVIEP